MDSSFSSPYNRHPFFLDYFTKWQRANIKGHLVDSNNRSHRLFPSFSLTHPELSPGFRIIDNFPDRFSFNLCNKKKNDKFHIHKLDSVVIELFLSQSIAIIAMDTSIKNNITTSISYTYISNQPLIKTIHHTAFVTSSEAELFAIRYGINQALSKKNVSKIIVITDSIHVAKNIFDTLSHPL